MSPLNQNLKPQPKSPPMKKYFGTDGIRGVANHHPLSAEFLARLGQAIGLQFKQHEDSHPRVVIGKDTRLSGYMIESALASGFVSVGMEVLLAGPIPTPAVSMLTRSMRAHVGVMISASHNPYEDNGLKLFGPNGHKLSDDIELQIEARLESGDITPSSPHEMGRMKRLDDVSGRYIEFLKSTLPRDFRMDGLKVVLDCAHGAAYKIAPLLLSELGAEVIPLGVTPNGININENCGATAPGAMCNAVISHQADLGISLDGDADRCIMCDEKGQLVDGDRIMAYLASQMQQHNTLRNHTLVATVMSNLGFENYLTSQGITLHRTKVGDRYVSAALHDGDFNLGGEQSGHVILSDYAPAGDGLLTALQILRYFTLSDAPASEDLQPYSPLPQVLKNVRIDTSILQKPEVQQLITTFDTRITQQNGRLLVRASGTEPLIRVMAEGEDTQTVEAFVDELIEELKKLS